MFLQNLPFIIIGIIILVTTIPLLIAAKKKGFFEAYAVIEDAIKQYMEEAEALRELSGAEKRDFVVEKVKEYMNQHKLSFPIDEVITIIERLIAFSKKVNK